MTVPRTRAIRAKRRWEKRGLRAERCASACELAAALAGGLELLRVEPRVLLGAFPDVERQLGDRHLAALDCVASVQLAPTWRREALIGSHSDVGALLGLAVGGRGLKKRRTGSVMRDLVEWGYLTDEPMFRPQRCVSSQRANAYALSAAARTALERWIARGRAHGWQSISSSKLPPNPEPHASDSGENTISPPGTGWQSPGSVSAAPTIDFVCAVPDARADGATRVPRQDATRTPPPEASQGDGVELVTDASEFVALLAQLQRGGAS